MLFLGVKCFRNSALSQLFYFPTRECIITVIVQTHNLFNNKLFEKQTPEVDNLNKKKENFKNLLQKFKHVFKI